MYRSTLRLVRQRRFTAVRPSYRPVLTPTYAWITVTVKVWAPTS